jgi:hypothetical protein
MVAVSCSGLRVHSTPLQLCMADGLLGSKERTFCEEALGLPGTAGYPVR